MTERRDHLEEASRSLGTLAPSTDLWAEAERRASIEHTAEVLPLEPAHSHPWRWVAAAAVLVLIVGTLVVINRASGSGGGDAGLANDPDTQLVETDSSGRVTPYTDGCPFAVTGEPLGPITWLEVPNYFPSGITGTIGDDQTFVINAPIAVAGGTAEVERSYVELEHGTAALLLSDEMAQVNLGGFISPKVCNGSVSVEVSGGSRNANREQAIALANRVVQEDEPLTKGSVVSAEWRATSAARISLEPEDEDEPAEEVSIDGIAVDFGHDSLTWTDGCDEFTTRVRWDDGPSIAGRVRDGSYSLRLSETSSTGRSCPPGVERSVFVHELLGQEAVSLFTTTTGGYLSSALVGDGGQLWLVADP